jgi:hypothetical protein
MSQAPVTIPGTAGSLELMTILELLHSHRIVAASKLHRFVKPEAVPISHQGDYVNFGNDMSGISATILDARVSSLPASWQGRFYPAVAPEIGRKHLIKWDFAPPPANLSLPSGNGREKGRASSGRYGAPVSARG